MSRFDEEPDGDPHGECSMEINRLKAANAELVAALEAMWDSACTNSSSRPSKAAFLKCRAALEKHNKETA